MSRLLHLPSACLLTSGLVTSCSYDFGGAGNGGAASSSDAASSGASTDPTSTVDGSAQSGSGDTASTSDAASTQDASSAEASTASTGSLPLPPCLEDDFDPFDAEWMTFGGNGNVNAMNGDVFVTGASNPRGAFRDMPPHPSDCYLSISFNTVPAPDVYIDVRSGQDAIALSLFGLTQLLFEVSDGDQPVEHQLAAPADVDALALVFAGDWVSAFARGGDGSWIQVGMNVPLPAWFADDPPDGTGFGVVDSGGAIVQFYDFSVSAVPPGP